MADSQPKFNPKNPDSWGMNSGQFLLIPALALVLLIGEFNLS